MAFPTGWGRKCPLVIDPAEVDAALTDFPVLFTVANLPSEMFDADGAHPALNGGGDIRFSSDSAGATQLACEVVSFVTNNDPALGTAQIHVKVPSISATVDTTIYVWYEKAGESQPAVTDTYGRNAVWGNSFAGVWHMEEDPSGSAPQLVDSTGNGYSGTSAGTMTSGDLVAGGVGNGWDFDGSNDYADVSAAGLLAVLAIANDFTVEQIFKWAGSGRNLFSAANNAANDKYGCGFFGNSLRAGTYNGTTFASKSVDFTDTASFHYLGSSNSNHSAASRLDGAAMTGTSGVGSGTTGKVLIGSGATGGDRIAAIIGCTRVSTVVRTAEWMDATHSTLLTPGTFAAAGTPEDGAGGGTVLPLITNKLGNRMALIGGRQI